MWVRRALTIPLGTLLFLQLLLILLILQVNDTVLNHNYYREELREADIYNFMMVDVLVSALDERRISENTLKTKNVLETPLVSSGLNSYELVISVLRTIPPKWIQGLTEGFLNSFVLYMTGQNDEFTLTIEVNDQYVALVSEIKALLQKSDFYELIYDEVIFPRVQETQDLELPLGIKPSSYRLMRSIRNIAPPEWIHTQVENALDDMTPYMLGETDTFEIKIDLRDRVDISLQELKIILRQSDAYDLLYSEVIEPKVLATYGDQSNLPYGISVSSDEVVYALRKVAPPSWVEDQVEILIDDVGRYIIGSSDKFATEVSLVKNKRQARQVLMDMVDTKIDGTIESIRPCMTAQEIRDLTLLKPGQLPKCIPPGVSREGIMATIPVTLAQDVADTVLEPVPDTVLFDDNRLRDALQEVGAGDNLDRIYEVRKILQEGYVVTNVDLENLLSGYDEGYLESLHNIRNFLSDGWSYTEADFIGDIAGELGTSEVVTLDNRNTYGILNLLELNRGIMNLARIFRPIIYGPLLLLIVVIAFLGSNTFKGRLLYGSGYLLIYAGLISIVFGFGYDNLKKSEMLSDSDGVSNIEFLRQNFVNNTVDKESDFPDTADMIANKVFDIGVSAVDSFAYGMFSDSQRLVVIALITIGAVIWVGPAIRIYSLVRRIRQGSKR